MSAGHDSASRREARIFAQHEFANANAVLGRPAVMKGSPVGAARAVWFFLGCSHWPRPSCFGSSRLLVGVNRAQTILKRCPRRGNPRRQQPEARTPNGFTFYLPSHPAPFKTFSNSQPRSSNHSANVHHSRHNGRQVSQFVCYPNGIGERARSPSLETRLTNCDVSSIAGYGKANAHPHQ